MTETLSASSWAKNQGFRGSSIQCAAECMVNLNLTCVWVHKDGEWPSLQGYPRDKGTKLRGSPHFDLKHANGVRTHRAQVHVEDGQMRKLLKRERREQGEVRRTEVNPNRA